MMREGEREKKEKRAQTLQKKNPELEKNNQVNGGLLTSGSLRRKQ